MLVSKFVALLRYSKKSLRLRKPKRNKPLMTNKKTSKIKKTPIKKNVQPKKTSLKKQLKTKPKITKKRKPVPKKPVAMTKKTTQKILKRPKKSGIIEQKKYLKFEEDRKAELRKFLIKKREEIIKEAKSEISKYIKGETKQLIDTALDDGDWSVVDLSEDISLRQLSVHRENLQRIDEALRKLKEGTYGICEDCGEEITEERLKILPFSIYCLECQEKRELLEELKKKEGL